MLAISFAYAVAAKNQSKLLKEGYASLVTNWDADMVFDLTTNAGYPLESGDFYLSPWSFDWPGTIQGCYCPYSNYYRRVYSGLKDRDCSYNETRSGCDTIRETNGRKFSNWRAGQGIFAVRGKSTSFLDSYTKMRSDGTCPSDHIHCGSTSSISKGICIPTRFGRCPLTDISKEAKVDYRKITLFSTSPEMTVYVTNSASNNPISDLLINEHHSCFLRSQYALTPGRSKYELMKGDWTNCKEDKNTWIIDDIGERSYYDANNFDYSYFPKLVPDDFYRKKLIVGRAFDWAPSEECQSKVPTLLSKNDEIAATYKQYVNLFIIYIISLSISCICIICQFAYIQTNDEKIVKAAMCIRVIMWLLVLPSICIVVARVNKDIKFFEQLSTMNCSNEVTLSNISGITDTIRSQLQRKNNIIIILAFCAIIIELVIYALYVGFCRNQTQDGTIAPSGQVAPTNYFNQNKNGGIVVPIPLGEKTGDTFPLLLPIPPPGPPLGSSGFVNPPTQSGVPYNPPPPLVNNNQPTDGLPPGFLEALPLIANGPGPSVPPNSNPPGGNGLPPGFLESVGRLPGINQPQPSQPNSQLGPLLPPNFLENTLPLFTTPTPAGVTNQNQPPGYQPPPLDPRVNSNTNFANSQPSQPPLQLPPGFVIQLPPSIPPGSSNTAPEQPIAPPPDPVPVVTRTEPIMRGFVKSIRRLPPMETGPQPAPAPGPLPLAPAPTSPQPALAPGLPIPNSLPPTLTSPQLSPPQAPTLATAGNLPLQPRSPLEDLQEF